MSWHQTTVIGHLGADPILNHTTKGKAVCNFSVAVNDRWYDRQAGTRREKTTWYRVTAWGERARKCRKHLSKGRKVEVTGNVSANAYISNSGQLRASLNLTAHDVTFIEIGGRHRRKRRHSSTEQIENLSTQPAQNAATRPIATQSDRRVAPNAVKHKPRSQGRASKTDKDGNNTFRANQRLEVEQIRAELGTLRNRHRQLTRLLSNVTYRGGKKSKNADYHDTKEQLIATEERIEFYERALAKASSSRPTRSKRVVQIGSTIVLKFSDSDEHKTFRIVASPLGKRGEEVISADSPIGSALLGKRKGNIVSGIGFERIQIVDVY